MDGSRRRQIGILGGSFNPVHVGHIMLASYLAQFTELDEVWLMLSPSNPLKSESAVSDGERLEMLRLACDGHVGLQPSDIELSMPRPSYTINSLNRLAQLYPRCDFRLIIGSDNWLIFDRWRAANEIISRFRPIVYPRPGYPVDAAKLPPEVTLVEAPTVDVSSTFIRRAIQLGKDASAFLPAPVWSFIANAGLYE